MNDDPIGTQPPSPELLAEAAVSQPDTAPAPAPQPAPAAAAPTPSLGQLLSEFETATAPAPAAPVQSLLDDPAQATPTPTALDPVPLMKAEFDTFAKAHRLENENKALQQEVAAARHYVDTQHFDHAVTAGEKMLADADLYVPADFVRGQLIAMATLNPQLAEAFDNRHQNPKQFERMLKKAHNRIYEAAKAMPDRDVSADRAAVAAAVRGNGKIPEPKAPRYGDMTEAEFTKEKAKYGI